MGKFLAKSGPAEALEAVESPEKDQSTQSPLAAKSSRPLPSYHPTAWPVINKTLDIVDRYSGRRAGWVQRFFSYTFFGGCAALVNLLIFYLVYYRIPLPVSAVAHNVIAYIAAAEISILANFIPNDYFTFRHLPGHSRSWPARCIRFHITTIGGVILTFLIEFGLSYLTHVPPIIAEAIALILVLIYNFSFHHIFTYRHVKHPAR